MHAVILAAGEGSRMGPHTDEVPKAFLELSDRTLYEHQRAVLDDHVDDVTITLGYAAEHVLDRIGSATAIVLDDWDDYDNAESLRRALRRVEDDVLVLNGDVVVASTVVETLSRRFRSAPAGRNVVGCLPGHQEGSTAIRCDDSGIVTEYGMVRGHQHAGIGIIDGSTIEAIERFLSHHREEWYPVVYPEFETEMVAVDPNDHVEINRPTDVVDARRKVSSIATGEADA